MSEIERQIQTENVMKEIGSAIDDTLKELFDNVGFVLITFEFKKPGIGNYISNGKRADIIKALRETADKLEANEDIPAASKTIQ